MKKHLLIFILFSAIAIFYLLRNGNLKTGLTDRHFVTINENSFSLNGNYFYPITINYIVSIQADKNGLWACPYTGYNMDARHRFVNKDSSLMELKADMDLIRELGFNSVRIVGIGELGTNNKIPNSLSIGARINNQRDTTLIFSNDKSYDFFFGALAELFDVINQAGLKTIFLTHISPENRTTEIYLTKLASRFKNDTSVMAYDLFNEPLYFDTLPRQKEDIYNIVKRWKKTLKMYAPHQLFTVGLTGIREVFEWDPNILDVDFVSFHPYDYQSEQVRNEMYWYGKYIRKPWMIGETAITADNDSVSYEEQKLFARKTLKHARDCGAIGYSWWQYKDVDWKDFLVDFQGIVTRKGITKTKKENIVVHGTPKPLVEEFIKYNPLAKKDSCICLPNYYNYSQFNQYKIKGRLMNDEDKPVEGGVILAWNQYWSKSYITITKADGSFELFGDFPFYHWMASATLYSMVRGDVSFEPTKPDMNGTTTVDIGTLKISALPFVN